jgi:methyltransferase (TIGR00027 family)
MRAMTMDALGLTSRWVAAARARESARADRLFDDPLAAALAGDEGRAMLEEMERVATPPGRPSENPYLAIRTRFFDDALMGAAREGTRQVAILAAGMDARAFRLAWPEGTTVFEVERAEVVRYKEEVLAAERATPRARRVVVAADLREDWRAKLREAGHDAAQPTAFLVEGLLPYLPDEAAALAIFAAAASIAAPGSRLATDVVGQSFLESPWVKTYLEGLAAKGVPWTFGTDEPEALLARAGWPHAHAVEPGDEGVSLGRWPYGLAPRAMREFPHSYLVVARR